MSKPISGSVELRKVVYQSQEGLRETSASLLERLRSSPDEAAWRRLDDLYRPLIRRWLLRDLSLHEEADDIVQEVMAVLVRELPRFRRRRNGSFRRWLRAITAHRLGALYRSRKNRPVARGGPQQESPLTHLADSNSELSQPRQSERAQTQGVFRVQRLRQPMEGSTGCVLRAVPGAAVPAGTPAS